MACQAGLRRAQCTHESDTSCTADGCAAADAFCPGAGDGLATTAPSACTPTSCVAGTRRLACSASENARCVDDGCDDAGRYCPLLAIGLNTVGTSKCPTKTYCPSGRNSDGLAPLECPRGHTCPEEELHAPVPCAAGRYGSERGMHAAAATCSGPCRSSYYCVSGSVDEYGRTVEGGQAAPCPLATPWTAPGEGRSLDDCVNQRPRFLGAVEGVQTLEVAEDRSPGSFVGTVEATDPDEQHSVDHALSTGHALFEVMSCGGYVRLRDDAAALDFETAGTAPHYTLHVHADDTHGGTDSVEVRITLTDVDEPPQITSASSAAVDENAATGSEVLQLQAQDDGENDVLAFTLMSGGDGVLAVSVGQQLVSAAPLDHEARSSCVLRRPSTPHAITLTRVTTPRARAGTRSASRSWARSSTTK